MTEEEKPKQNRLLSQSETGDWVAEPDDPQTSRNIGSVDTEKPKKDPKKELKEKSLGSFSDYEKEELEELFKTEDRKDIYG